VELGLRLVGSVDQDTVLALSRANGVVGPFEPTTSARLLGPVEPSPTVVESLPDPGEPGFDVAELRALLDGPHADVKHRVRALLSQPEFRIPVGLPTPEYRDLVHGWVKCLADEGIGGLGMPTAYGGGGDPGGFVAAFGTLGHHDLSLLTKFGVQFGLFAGAVLRLGTEPHHRSILPGAIDLSIPGSFAMTETGHGSNVADLEVTATYLPDDDCFVIETPTDSARKDYIGNAIHASRAVVFARLKVGDLDHGVHAFDVPLRAPDGSVLPGVHIEDAGEKVGLNGVDNGRIWFHGVRVPRQALLDRYATIDADGHYDSSISSPARRFFTTLGTLVGGRVSVGAAAISAAETALAIAVRYATRRRQFGTVLGAETPIMEYRSHQRRLMPRLALTIVYHLTLADLIDTYVAHESEEGDTDLDRRNLEARAAGLKAYATWHALDVIGEARQACGGQGYMAENRLGALRDDADVFTTFEGDNTVLAQLLAKSLLTDYRSSFEDLTPGRLLRYVRDRVNAAITESVPILGALPARPDQPDVRSQLLGRRSAHSVETLARRVKARTDDGMSAAEAFLDVQPHSLHAARASVECWLQEVSDRVLAGIADPLLAEVMGDVVTLAVAWMVEQDLGWYLEHGLLNPDGAGEIRATVIRLSERLTPHARHLVDAFGIPDEVLAAPIAL
jgi:acyl-CoA oxidase